MDIVPPLNSTNTRYINANTSTGEPGSVVDAKFFNDIQEEIINVIINAKIDPDPNVLNQLYTAIKRLISDDVKAVNNGLEAYKKEVDKKFNDNNKVINNSINEVEQAITTVVDGASYLSGDFNALLTPNKYFITTTQNVTKNAPINITANWWVTISIFVKNNNRYILQEARIHNTSQNSEISNGAANMLVRCGTITNSSVAWGKWQYSYAQFGA